MVVVGGLSTDSIAFSQVLARASLIHHAVAVVVFSVTDFGGWFRIVDARSPLAIDATCLVALGAFPYVGAALLGGIGSASTVVVDFAVTIVVFTVYAIIQACFVVAGGLADSLVVHETFATNPFADSLVVAWATFIHHAVAVVVFSVAEFVFGGAVFLGLGAYVVFDPSQVGADAVWLLLVVAWAAEVDVAITVIVFEIGAVFFGGEHLTDARSPLSLLALLNATATNSFSHGVQRSVVTDSLFTWCTNTCGFRWEVVGYGFRYFRLIFVDGSALGWFAGWRLRRGVHDLLVGRCPTLHV